MTYNINRVVDIMRKFLLAALAAGSLFAAPQQAANPAQAANPNQALINRYCVTCHNQRLKTAKLELDKLDLAHPEKDALIWERAVRKLRAGMMPPPGASRPPVDAVNALATYLEDSLDKAAAASPNPGSVRIHRLNRAEYANAMRDLFGIDVNAAALLPTDGISDGFDNIAGARRRQTGDGSCARGQRSEDHLAGRRCELAPASRSSRRSHGAVLGPV